MTAPFHRLSRLWRDTWVREAPALRRLLPIERRLVLRAVVDARAEGLAVGVALGAVVLGGA